MLFIHVLYTLSVSITMIMIIFVKYVQILVVQCIWMEKVERKAISLLSNPRKPHNNGHAENSVN